MRDKKIVVGVSGGIAAYKACEIVSSLKKLGADVHVIMTQNATEFVSSLTFESLSGNSVTVGMFGQDRERGTHHISLAKSCDIALIAPCTANVVAKIAAGIADDFLSTFVMATKAPVIIAPAMNTNMYESLAYRQNELILKQRGYLFVQPDCGNLACGDSGKGRLAQPKNIVEFLHSVLARKQELLGKSFLITAGGTISPIDPVRCIANHSSGKMGIEIARAAVERGATVRLILGKTTEVVDFDCEVTRVSTTDEMYSMVVKNLEGADCIIKAAAPSDYKVVESTDNKIKADRLVLTLEKGVDIASEVGKIKGDKKLIIFAAETQNLIENARAKLKKKNADMIVANNITLEGAGFDCDTNIASLIFANGKTMDLQKMSKRELANIILDNVATIL